jgi:hypothetical protein
MLKLNIFSLNEHALIFTLLTSHLSTQTPHKTYFIMFHIEQLSGYTDVMLNMFKNLYHYHKSACIFQKKTKEYILQK